MLEHINIETHLLDDQRIQALIDDYGLAGLGAYLLLRTQIDAQSADQGLPLDYLLKHSTPYIRKGKLLPILRNYGLFSENPFGLVRTCAPVPALASPALASPARQSPEDIINNNIFIQRESIAAIKRRFQKPTVEEVDSYCRQRQNHVDATGFCNFYESKGWMVGKAKMVDWQAAVRTWERREEKPLNPRHIEELNTPAPPPERQLPAPQELPERAAYQELHRPAHGGPPDSVPQRNAPPGPRPAEPHRRPPHTLRLYPSMG